jgi:hypothetical protein
MALLTGGRTAALAAAAIAVAALASGCYQPSLRDCTVTCTGADDCAGDQVCGSDGYCALPEMAGNCGDAGGATADAPAAADADPAAPDAADGEPDASIPDASLPDAAGPPVTLKVRIQGLGRVVSEAYGISCDNMCDYELPMGSVVTLSPVETTAGWTFRLWNTTPCAGQTPDCTLTLSEPEQTARARFQNN